MAEPREGAFGLLVPEGWTLDGGVQRAVAQTNGDEAATGEASLAFSVQDATGRVRLRHLPAKGYWDGSRTIPGCFARPLEGSYVGGRLVLRRPAATTYLSDVLFPEEHPTASEVRLLVQRALPAIADAQRSRAHPTPPSVPTYFDAACAHWIYSEDGVDYQELAFTLLEDRGILAGGESWKRRETWTFRAPRGELAAYTYTFMEVVRSVEVSSTWRIAELEKCFVRAGIRGRVSGRVDRIAERISVDETCATRELLHALFPTSDDPLEFIDPFDGSGLVGTPELGPFRWQAADGSVLYSQSEAFDPNVTQPLARETWLRCRVRPEED